MPLLFAGASKLDVPEQFLDFISKLGIAFPWNQIALVSVIFVEMLLGVLCLVGVYLRVILCAIMILLLLFSIVIAIALIMNLQGSCGCFGGAMSGDVDGLSLLRNLLLAGIAAYARRLSLALPYLGRVC